MSSQGRLFIDVDGLTLSAEDCEILANPAVAGVVLLGKNYQDPVQLKNLCGEIHRVKSNLIISVDQEGGRVQRFIEGFDRMPAASEWGERYAEAKGLGKDAVKFKFHMDYSESMQALKACGIDMNLAPVIDIKNDISKVINSRALSSKVKVINELSSVQVDVLHELEMPAVGKHFPGHGSAVADSHVDFPVDERSLDDIRAYDLQPFQKLCRDLDYIMPAHVIYPAVDDMPAGFSRVWLKDILRGELGFKGKIISDCISMKAASVVGDFPARAKAAFDAGCDIVTVCNCRQGVKQILAG